MPSKAPERDGVLAEGDDLELNMTPMIDIVFQLIVFFLLSLKFKTVDERLDALLPKDRGEVIGPPVVDAAAVGLALVPASLIGLLPGLWIGHRIPKPRLRAISMVILAAVALYALLRP